MSTFTLIHVAISLIGILTGLIVAFGLLVSKRLDGVTAIFLLTTVATSVTGFFFPYHGITPGIVIGIISMVLLTIAIAARYFGHLAGPSRWIYVVTALLALYLNCFILVVQLFEKVPALHALDPKQSGPPFKFTQLTVLVLFIILIIAAATRFRVERARAA